ncbi:MAG: hypothetical protein KAR56_02615 [Thermoplasmata archaeon]|nr:hypothetical protein [Thermoplasmata archaeon]
MSWEEINRRIDEEVTIGTKVPKTDGKNRIVTRIVGNRIYMRTGVQTKAEKYTTKQMLQYAYEKIQSGEKFTSTYLESNFPKEYSQGACIFSMTGGTLELLGLAEYTRMGYISK